MLIQDILDSMKARAKAIERLERTCDCPLEYDPYCTGDRDFAVRSCQRRVCVEDVETTEDEDDEEQ